jgi:methylenetetrahydrofolate reductase (NADPH)
LLHPKYELIPLKNVLDQTRFLPDGAVVTVTASPQRGMMATIDLAIELKNRGFRLFRTSLPDSPRTAPSSR